MSSYLNIYIKPEGKPATEVFSFSRNNPVYEAIHDNVSVVYVDKLDCKEWYAYRRKGDLYKHVKTKAEAIEPIPENAEFDKGLDDYYKGRTNVAPNYSLRKYVGYFIDEEYDALPSDSEMIENNATELTENILESIVNDLDKDIESARKRQGDTNLELYKALNKYFPEKAVDTSDMEEDAEGWNEYIADLCYAKNVISALTWNKSFGSKIYCYID